MFSSDQPYQVVLYRGEVNTVRFTYTNQMYLMKDIRIALDGSGKSLTAQTVPGMGHVYEGFQTSARGIFTMSGVPESTIPVANPNAQTKYTRYFKVIDDMHNTMYKGTVFLVQPQAWKYTVKSIDQLVVDDLNHIGADDIERMTTLIKTAAALLTTGGSGSLPDNIKVSINPRGGQAMIIYGDGSTDIIPPAVLWKKRLEKDNAEEGLTTSPKIVHDVRDSEQEEGDHDDEEQTGEPIFLRRKELSRTLFKNLGK